MKIGLQLEENGFEQDIRELLMAFYPGAVFVYGDQEAPGLELRVEGTFLEGRSRYRLQVERLKGKAAEDWEALAEGRPVLKKGFREAEENAPFAIDPADRKESKDRIKRRLYFLLALDTGRLLPWGSLTGIRPVKIPEGLLAEGWAEEKISSYMEEHYLTGKKKRELSLAIAQEERRLLSRLDYQKGYSLYVGIPFCPTTCLYCSFTSYPIARWKERLDDYLDILEKECQIAQERMGGKKELQTIYVGGGTPTSLPEAQLERLLAILRNTFALSGLREFTVEAGRPDSITREKLEILKAYGVGRISINPQSMDQETLELIGRQHTVEQVLEVFSMARELGFANINMDIILGLPGEGKEKVARTLEQIRSLHPESLTVHCLALKRAARLNLEKDRYQGRMLADGPVLEALVELAAREAKALGMTPYYLYRQKNMAGNLENVGYACGDKACLYNILMMEEKHTVVGCGAGTTTKAILPEQNRVERLENIKNIQEYLPRYQEVLEKKDRFLQLHIR